MRGPVLHYPAVTLVGIGLPRIRPIVRGVLGKHVPKHPVTLVLAASFAHLPDDIPPTA
jgi:hypothetical protein